VKENTATSNTGNSAWKTILAETALMVAATLTKELAERITSYIRDKKKRDDDQVKTDSDPETDAKIAPENTEKSTP
jgi:hypothetical protein